MYIFSYEDSIYTYCLYTTVPELDSFGLRNDFVIAIVVLRVRTFGASFSGVHGYVCSTFKFLMQYLDMCVLKCFNGTVCVLI